MIGDFSLENSWRIAPVHPPSSGHGFSIPWNCGWLTAELHRLTGPEHQPTASDPIKPEADGDLNIEPRFGRCPTYLVGRLTLVTGKSPEMNLGQLENHEYP